jgi:hypothetical protein
LTQHHINNWEVGVLPNKENSALENVAQVGTSFFKKLLQTFEKWSFSILKLFVKVIFGGGKG